MLNVSVTIVGNLTEDPELRFTPTGVAVARMTIAHNPRTRNADGTWTDGEPTFLPATAWRQLAENAAESLREGARVVAIGRLRTERWPDKATGEDRSRMVLDLDALGPDLAYATATVKRMARSNQGAPDDPWTTASRTRPATRSTDPAGDSTTQPSEPPF